MDPKEQQLHLVMFPFFAFGHISPFVQLSNKLISHGLRISFFSASANVPRISSMLIPSPNAQIVPLTLPPVDGLPPGIENTSDLTPAQSELLKVAMDLMQTQIKTLLSQLNPHFVVFDFAQEWLPKLASDLGIKTCFYSVFIALSTAFLTVPARLNHKQEDSGAKFFPSLDQLKLPPPGFPKTSLTSVKTFEARDFMYMFRSFHGKSCVYDRVVSGLTGCSAIIAKSCREMEAPYIEYVRSQFNKPVLLVGPIVPSAPANDPLDAKFADWLSKFAAKSVVFCSFGSETFLNDDQIEELALGLELTGLPFILILNFPTTGDADKELEKALPKGFTERVKERAIISTGWVQQQQILAHPSVGCYLNHGGFSSVMEAVVNDCQVVMMPQKGDQFLNTKLVSGDWGAGIEVRRRDEDGGFGKEDVREAVESVMVRVSEEPGRSIRENHGKWRELFCDEGFEGKLIGDLVEELGSIIAFEGMSGS